MKKILSLFLILFTLSGCASSSATKAVAESVARDAVEIKESVELIEKELPDSCKTISILGQISSVKTRLEALEAKVLDIPTVCETEKSLITALVHKWKAVALSLLLALIGAVYAYIKR